METAGRIQERISVVLAARGAIVLTGAVVSATGTSLTEASTTWALPALAVAASVVASLLGRSLPVPWWVLDLAAIMTTRLLAGVDGPSEPIIGLIAVPVMAGAAGRSTGVVVVVVASALSFGLHPSAPDGAGLGVTVAVLALLATVGAALAELNDRQLAAGRAAAERTRRLEAVLSAVVRHDPRGVVVRDGDGRAVELNEAAATLLGLDGCAYDAFAGPEATLPPTVVDEDGRPLREPLAGAIARRTGDVVSEQVIGVVHDAGIRWLAISAVPVDTAAGRWVVSHFRDATEETTRVVDLEAQVVHDPLTGAGNRRLLERTLDAIGDEERVAAVVLDIDEFKAVNDRHGHDIGDEILRHVADRLRAASRPGDVVIRLGGDEFLLLLRGVDGTDLDRTVSRLRRSLQDPYHTCAGVLRVSASVGIAAGRAGLDGALVRDADEAMYDQKRRRAAAGSDGALS